MRVLMAMAGLGGGGAERFFERLAHAFADSGHDLSAVIRPNAAREHMLTRAGVDVSTARFGGPFDLTTGRRIRRLIGRTSPEIVLSFMSRAARFVPRSDGRYVHVARLGGYYDLKNYRTAGHLVGNTRHLCNWLIAQGAAADRVSYIPNFVTPSRSAPLDRSVHVTPAGSTLVVALGRLHRNKAFDILLSAIAEAPGLWLWLAGDGPEAAALKAQAGALGIEDRVRFLGWLDDPGSAIAAADIVAVPSRHEPLGNVVLEAWSYAKPVVAARATGPAALIADRVDGRLVPPDDAAALAAALSDVADATEKAAAMGAAGLEKLKADFSPDRVVRQYVELFEHLLERQAA